LKKLNLILMLAAGLTLPAVSAAAGQNQYPFKTPVIAQYFGIWTETDRGQTWEQKFRDDTPFEKLNRIYIAFGKIVKTEDGHFSIEYDGEVRNAQAVIDRVKAVNPSAEIFISLGGDGRKDQFGGAANDPRFADNVRAFLEKYGLNGLDIDWEMGLNREGLNSLVTSLSSSLHTAGYKVTLAGWPNSSYAYDMAVLKDKLDQINIMSYGRGTSLEYSVNQYVKSGFPADKLIGGIEVEVPYRQSGGTDSLGADGTIAQKANYALTHGLAGMMEWRLDNDYPDESNLNFPRYKGAILLWDIMAGQKK